MNMNTEYNNMQVSNQINQMFSQLYKGKMRYNRGNHLKIANEILVTMTFLF